MAWSTKIKDLSVTSVRPHALSPVPAGVTGRAPANLRISFTPTARTPDFVFSRPGAADVALVESKGTRSATVSGFDTTVRDGYTKQVEPHLGHMVGTATASHGFCIGGWLTDPAKAELNVHHTD